MWFIYVDNLIVEGDAPEEEILSILDVPPGKMGLIIGRRGSSILAIKKSCEYISSLSLSVLLLFLDLYMHYALDAFFSLLCGNTSMVTQFFILNSFFCRAEILIGGAKGPPDKVSLQIF